MYSYSSSTIKIYITVYLNETKIQKLAPCVTVAYHIYVFTLYKGYTLIIV